MVLESRLDASLSVACVPSSCRKALAPTLQKSGKILHRAPPRPITASATTDVHDPPTGLCQTTIELIINDFTSPLRRPLRHPIERTPVAKRTPRTMASLRTQSAAKMLRAAAAPATRVAVAPKRWQSSVTSAPAAVPAVTTTNQPDYTIQADKAASYVLSSRIWWDWASC